MTLPTVNDVQAVEPILQNLLVGYSQADDRFVAGRVFPPVSVDKDSGTYYIFTKKYFFHDTMAVRPVGGKWPRSNIGVETDTYNTNPQYADGYQIPDEVKANSQLPLDLEQVGVRKLAQALLLNREIRFSTDFMATSVWGTDDSNATTDWDDFTSGDPRNDVLTAVRTISNKSGVAANTMVMGNIVEQALLLHPDILDVLKYTQVAGVQNVMGALASVLGVGQILVGRATYSNTNESAAFATTPTQIIDDDCLICYVNPSPSLFAASAGYTFNWQPGGGMGTMQSTFRDEEAKANLLRINSQIDQKAVAADVGYFFSDVV
jgi:hypothetical protein